jgi:hypothetical protein
MFCLILEPTDRTSFAFSTNFDGDVKNYPKTSDSREVMLEHLYPRVVKVRPVTRSRQERYFFWPSAH